MMARRFSIVATLVAGFAFSACGSNSATADYCGSPDPCGCVPFDPARSCVAEGASCVCTAKADDAGALDSGAGDASEAGDAPPALDIGDFIGAWSPSGGTGEANCSGEITSLPPDPGAVLTFVQSGPNMLTATSSGAAGCTLTLVVSGATATLAQASEVCAVPTGGSVNFNTFTLVSGSSPPDAGTAVDGASFEDAGTPVDGGDDGDDAGDAGDSIVSANALDWQLADTESDCVTTLHYTLARLP